MLGRLKMSIEECITAYKKILPFVFVDEQSLVTHKDQYDAGKLEAQIKEMLKTLPADRNINEDSKLIDDQNPCKT